jgi:carbamoyl-phosphate synthase small subunit
MFMRRTSLYLIDIISSVNEKAWLAVESGEVYEGLSAGARGETSGELVFNTGMTGYVEVLTDPSYFGQIVVMTQPHIGNYGVQLEDFESAGPAVSGFCLQDLTEHPHHPRSRHSLRHFLTHHKIPAIAGVPTRELTLLLREKGALRAIVTTEKASAKALVARAKDLPSMAGRNLADRVTTAKPYLFKGKWTGKRRIAVLDFGVKRSLLACLASAADGVKVFPAGTSARALAEERPSAYVVSNGPGDPAAMPGAIKTVRELLELGKPVLGVCLGHQLIGLAAGGDSYKLSFGHHGINHPVREEATGKILITTQNHGFAVKPDSLSGDWVKTHVSLNDGTLEGFRHKKKPIYALQFHPEAGPGPLEAREALSEFLWGQSLSPLFFTQKGEK